MYVCMYVRVMTYLAYSSHFASIYCIYILPHTALHLYTATYCTAECATHPHCSVRQYLDTYIDQTHFDGKTLIFGVCRLLESNVYSCILLHGPCSTAWSMHAVEYTSTHYLRDVNTRVHMTCEMFHLAVMPCTQECHIQHTNVKTLYKPQHPGHTPQDL